MTYLVIFILGLCAVLFFLLKKEIAALASLEERNANAEDQLRLSKKQADLDARPHSDLPDILKRMRDKGGL